MDSKRIAVIISIIFIIFLILPCYAISFQRGIKDIALPMQITFETSPVQSMTVSQNGDYMVIASGRKGFTDLWKLSADPRQVILPERLTSDPSTETDPAFSPDNRFIVYTGTGYDVKGDIFFLDLNNKGAGPFRLTDRSTEDGGPCFAPDGDIIYFHQKRPGNNFKQIVSLNPNNKSLKVSVLETNCDGSFPSVSPDGRKICFVSYDKDPSGDIFLFDINQKIVRELTEGPFIDFSPSWSSDGKIIFFSRVSMDSDRDGSISEKDTASAYKISVEDENLKVYPVTPENEHITNLITAGGRLFYISDRLSGIPNSWSLPEEGMIPGQENADKQLEFAEVMERYIPNPYLKILLYYAVPGNFPREPEAEPDEKPDKAACAKYWIGKMYRKEKMADAAVRVFDEVRMDCKGVEPYYSLSGIEKIAIETEMMMEETADSTAREKIVTKAIEELNTFSGHEYQLLSARAGIESSKLLQKAGGAEKLLEAIKILDKIEKKEKSQAAGRAEVAEAMILKAGIYDNIGSVDQVYPLYMSIIHNYPDQSGPAEIAVGSILNKAISGMGYEHFNRKIDQLIKIAEENQDKAPLLAMGALNRAGDLYFAEDRWSPAKDVYRRVLDEFPASETQTAARFSLAEILFKEERFREALKLYEKEISFRPAEDKIQRLAKQGYIRKSVAAGEYLYRLGEVYTAQNRFSELIDYDASIVEAHRGYIKCAASLNLMEKTLEHYRQRLQKYPDDPVAVYCVGLCLTYIDTKESVEEARKLLIRSVNMNGQIEYFHQTLGYVFEVMENVYNQKGNLENALESYKKAYFLNNPELNPDNTANLLLNLGNTYFSLGHFHRAFSIYKDLQEIGKPFDNKDREILFYRRLGMAAFQVDENKESIDAFSKALALIKDTIDPPDALDDFEYSGHLDSMKAEVLDRLGLAFQEDRNWEAAVKTFEKAFELNKKLDLEANLAVNRRSIAYNQYRQSETLFGKEKEQLLGVAAENFIKASELVEKYGVAGKKKKAEEGLINLDLQVSIDKTGSTAAGRGFSVEQEKRLAETFISRIYLELGRLAPAESAIEKQLKVYKQGIKISDSDLFGVSLLFHRAGLIATSRKNFHKAFEYFRRSAELCLRMKNSVSIALNVANMAHVLARTGNGRVTVVSVPDKIPGQMPDQETGGRDFNDSLRLLSDLDKKASNLLRVSDFASEGAVEAIYHNTMGVFWMSMGQRNRREPAETVKQIEQYRKAICHFLIGIKTLKSIGNYSKRKKIELEATLHLNMADVSRQLGEGDQAKQHYESTLAVIQKGFLPDLEWRALAGLGRYNEALLKLENVMITRAGCGPFEITGTFGGKIIELSDQGDIEGAFNLMEKLSELERFNRTAFIFRTSCENNPDFYIDLYPRLVAISDLKIKLKSAKGSEKDYFKERINDEEKLVKLRAGDNLEKLPEVISMISDKDMQEKIIILLGIACHAEAIAEDVAEDVEASDNKEAASRLLSEYNRLVRLYREKREEIYFSRPDNIPADIVTLLGPEPFEDIDVMDTLSEDGMLVRLFNIASPMSGNIEKPICRFVVDMEGINFSRHSSYHEALNDIDFDGVGSPYIVCEDTSAFSYRVPCALNSAHLVRSIMNRRPFKGNLLSLPRATNLPEGYSPIFKPEDNINTLIVSERVLIAGSVPVRAGKRPFSYPAIDINDSGDINDFGRQRLERYLLNKPGLSLALFTDVEPDDIYVLGHLSAIYGCPSILVSLSGKGDTKFIDAFVNEYKKTSALDAKIHSGNMTTGKGKEWILLGYKGMKPDEAKAFASKRFAKYVKKGKTSFDAGSFLRALGYFEDAVKIALKNDLYNKYMSSLYRYARESAYKAGDIKKAAEFAEMLSETLEHSSPDTVKHAEALLYQGLIYAKIENYGKALPVMDEAVEIFENLEANLEKADAMASLGTVLENAAEYERALESFSYVASSGIKQNRSSMTAAQYRNMGRIYDLRLSRYPVAIKYYQKALALYSEMNDVERTAESFLNIGRCYRLMGNFGKADKFYKEAEAQAQKASGNRRLMAEIVIEQANSAWFGAAYEKAFRMQRKALTMAKENNMPGVEVLSLNTSGLIWWALGNNRKAMREFDRALIVAGENKIRRDEVATTYNNMGLVFRETEQYQKALEMFDKALLIDRELKSRWAIAYDLRNKGLTFLQMGDAERSIPLFQEAVSEAHAIGNRINKAKALSGLGMAYAEIGNIKASEEAFKKALNLAEEMSMPETGWRSLYGLAKLKLSEQGDEAEKLLKQAVKKIEAMRADLKIDKLKESFVNNKLSVYKTLVTLLADRGRVTESFEIAERSRARNFIDLLGNQQISLKNSTDQELFNRQAFLRTEIDHTERLLTGSRKTEEQQIYRERLNQLNNDYNDLMLDIQAGNPQLASFVSVAPLKAEKLIAELDEGVALLAYYILSDELFCWVIKPGDKEDGIRLVRTPLNTEPFKKEILDFRRRIQNLEPLKDQSQSLYNTLIAGVMPHLGDVKKLGIIPHGSLHYLSFATLFNGKTYLVDDFSLFYLPSASIYKYTKTRRNAAKNTKVLAIGNPNLGTEALNLPFAEHEVESIRWNFPDITVLTGEKATESWVVKNISRFGIIHLATHGEFDAVNPLFSAIMLSKGENLDGNLETSEVFGLDIQADMIILSACQTGLGKVTGGDDVIGLNRAFFYAGTHTMISSLWRVSDVSTAVLTKAFYRRYRTYDKADSLRLAVLHVKNKYPHPGYWGAFILSGDYY